MARTAKKGQVIDVTPPAAPKTPEEIFKDHYPELLEAKVASETKAAEKRSADGIFRKRLQVFKKAGGDVDALLGALKDRLLDPEEVTRRIRNYNRYARLMNLPIGAQMGLFDDGETVATKTENDARDAGPVVLNDKALTAIEQDGFDAGMAGKTLASGYEEGSPPDLAFGAGWRRGQEKLVERMAPAVAG